MVSVSVSINDLDKTSELALKRLLTKLTVPINNIVTHHQQECKKFLDGNNPLGRKISDTGKLKNKIKVNTYKSGKHKGSVIKPGEISLFIARPSKVTERIMTGLQFGLPPHIGLTNVNRELKRWVQRHSDIKFLYRKDGKPRVAIPIGLTKNSAYYEKESPGLNPIARSYPLIMKDIERHFNIKFK